MGKLMILLKHIGRILFVASWCLATLVLAAPDPECGERVSLDKLIANPEKYHGKEVLVVAHITIDFENMTACPTENETQMKSCLWINIDDGSYKTEQDYPRYEAMLQNWKRFDSQIVAIHATFDKGEKGHFSMWPGGLRQVTKVSGSKESWSFANNAAVSRNCLTDK
jgi:rubrerythrin